MIFDLSQDIDKQNAITRFKYLLDKKKKINLVVKHPKRSIAQNSYMHLLFSYFGLETGYTLEEVKQTIFKQIVNPEYFYEGEKEGLVNIQRWKSTKDLSTKEMTDCVDRFLKYGAENGIRLPTPQDLVWLEEIEKQVINSNSKYL